MLFISDDGVVFKRGGPDKENTGLSLRKDDYLTESLLTQAFGNAHNIYTAGTAGSDPISPAAIYGRRKRVWGSYCPSGCGQGVAFVAIFSAIKKFIPIMNPALLKILHLINKDQSLSAEEKQEIKDAIDKELHGGTREKPLAEWSALQALLKDKDRELEIEAALERVREKAMAMHRSEDLNGAVATVFEELDRLSPGMLRCGIGILDREKWTADVWTTVKTEKGTTLQVSGDESMDIHPLLRGAFEAWLKREEFSYILQGEDLTNYYNALSATNFRLPGAQQVLSEKKGLKQYYFVATFQGGGLFAFNAVDFSAEAKTVIRRFARVFDLTYKRFLDLQKAEAQTREAQIETALERVRSKALSMQKSEDLSGAVAVVFEELEHLKIKSLRCGISIISRENRTTNIWSTTRSEKGVVVQVSGDESMDIHPLLQGAYNAWLKQEDFSYLLKGEDAKSFYEALAATNFRLPDAPGKIEEGQQYMYVAHFPAGGLYVFSETAFSGEAKNVIKRFADVFNLAYTRFNDLKQAEALAWQAQQDLENLKTEKKRTEEALVELKATQAQLIQAEKMASLGELTAGIAHEIQNPLNFVNNFSEMNRELIEELKIEKAKPERNEQLENELLDDIAQNFEKINHHGRRAEAIVRGMLQHSRTNTGQKDPVDINALADEYLRLAYHGLRAKDKTFNATLKTDFDDSIDKVNIIPQEIGRVLLNLYNNAFYAVNEKKKQRGDAYEPVVSVGTKRSIDKIEINVSDNGNGIPLAVAGKIFQPFFTTKPAGQGTGLGLSLSYDIVTKGHGGELKVSAREGEGAVFTVILPA